MESFERYGIYYAPARGPLQRFTADWLGWCPVSGTFKPHLDIQGLPRQPQDITASPRKYGFHGTLKPPFRLAEGKSRRELEEALALFAMNNAKVRLDGLRLATIGNFVALVPEGDSCELTALAAGIVEHFDEFRAPASPSELERRRQSGLSARQDTLLLRWGYPYVQEEFRFHLTLTGKLSEDETAQTMAALDSVLAPLLPRPFEVRDLCLFGEAADGMFHLIHRYPLNG